MTAGPLAGPASAYPTFRTPASICFSGANEVFVPGLIVGRCARCRLAGLRGREADRGELGGGDGDGGAAEVLRKLRRVGDDNFCETLGVVIRWG